LPADEKKRVEEEFHRASNAAKLLQLSQAALDALSEKIIALGLGQCLSRSQKKRGAVSSRAPCDFFCRQPDLPAGWIHHG
jgi:hypothetical protein